MVSNITASPEETRIFFPAEALFASGSTHEAVLQFSDLADPPTDYETAWSFTVETYTDQELFPVIPAALAQPLENLSDPTRGLRRSYWCTHVRRRGDGGRVRRCGDALG